MTRSSSSNAIQAINKVPHCANMAEVRAGVNALDDVLVPLLVERTGYMTEAARIKNDESLVRDEQRIETIVQRVRRQASAEGGNPDLIERIYRALMECCIEFEHQELKRLTQSQSQSQSKESAA